MSVRIRFFARFREFFGSEVTTEVEKSTPLTGLIRSVTNQNREGHEAIFDEEGRFRRYVIVMKNGERIGISEAEMITVSDGDEIAIFPPVAGG
jgi:molybdopterin synthase sulfur carrier subunit